VDAEPAPVAPWPASRPTHLRRAFGPTFLAVLVGLVVFAAGAIIINYWGADSDRLRRSGGRSSGVVLVLSGDTRYSSGSALVGYEVGGTSYRESVDLGSDADGYSTDQKVEVYFDRAHPAHMTIDHEDNMPGWLVLPTEILIVAGILALGFGAYLGYVAVRTVRAPAYRPLHRRLHR
jgi:hypothetical protein